MNFIDKKTSVGQAIAILSKNGIRTNEREAVLILDFLYLISKNHERLREKKTRKP
ncbi:hypothetical protein CHRY9393_01490 [Chryseobacterium fistulae]|uniref:PTS sugar transporter subunit IIBC n=1 Tax=Chryseobacterium fistulae TaxID=2675058 RepID=A0A6N4XTS9_9FLAO|nr:hypothetical protein CHRY9393_01490 [Chryseobacterium fistulae]